MVARAPSPTVSARGEMDYLYSSLSAVTPENHPRTAKLLASSTRKTAQNVIEEAGEVALAAVKHQTRGIINESADLLYHLVAPWHRAGAPARRGTSIPFPISRN
jgi:phosphoribosyl-ATP pyrophosphohydrolase